LRKRKNTGLFIVVITFLIGIHSTTVSAQEKKKPFTVTDEIGLTLFDDPNGAPAKVLFSPDGNYVAVWAERGRLDLKAQLTTNLRCRIDLSLAVSARS
jgi:hypothetical protein